MGILDNKHRVVDSTITQEGRRQLASGMMKIEYCSFTDREVFYQSSSVVSPISNVPIADDASNRFYFESPLSLPEDQITPEANDVGLINVNLGGIKLANGQAISSKVVPSSNIIGSSVEYQVLSGAAFASQIDGLLTSSFDNFEKLNLIKSKDRFFDTKSLDQEFDTSVDGVSFRVSQGNSMFQISDFFVLEYYPDMLSDIKTSLSPNFMFLPPIKKLPKDTSTKNFSTTELISSFSLGTYQKQRRDLYLEDPEYGDSLTYEILNSSYITNKDGTLNPQKYFLWGSYNGLKGSQQKGYLKNIDLMMTSLSTKMAMQIFEVKGKEVKKLDVLSLGTFNTGDQDHPEAEIFMLGKVFEDSSGRNKFFHIFTLVFD